MNRKLSLICLLVGIVSLNSFSNNSHTYFVNEIEPKTTPIELEKILDPGLLNSSIIPYKVEWNDQFIDVIYLRNQSSTNVEVLDEMGNCVYRVTVNPVSGEHLYIDISDWDEGNYTIYFRSRAGGVICGTFELKQ